MLRAVRILPFAALIIACSPTRHAVTGDDVDAAGSGGNPGSGNNTGTSLVYAHTGSVLYRVDSSTLSTVEVGPLTGLGNEGLTDLAVDKNENMVGITLSKLYSIVPTTGAATLVSALPAAVNGATSLSYIPSDLTDPNSTDILVTADSKGAVYEIDPGTGSATMIGSYGSAAGGKIVSSGDLIGVRNLGIYATVNVGSAANDYLAKIDPATWAATPLGTGTGFKNIFGLGFWAGTIYGFTMSGQMITIDINSGAGTMASSGTQQWFGAGVTTDAPIIQ
jgi:hypothetical protein